MLVFGGLAHAPLHLRSRTGANLRAKHFLSNLIGIPRENRFSTIVAGVIVGRHVDASRPRGRKVVDDNSSDEEIKLSKKNEEKDDGISTSKTKGVRRRRKPESLTGDLVTVSRTVQVREESAGENKGGESNRSEAQSSGIRKRPTRRTSSKRSSCSEDTALDSSSGDAEKLVTQRVQHVATESSGSLKRKRTKKLGLQSAAEVVVAGDDAAPVAGTEDDARQMEAACSASGHACCNARRLEDAQEEEQEFQALQTVYVDASSTRKFGQESTGTLEQQRDNGTDTAALDALSQQSVESFSYPAFELSKATGIMVGKSSGDERINSEEEIKPEVAQQDHSARPLYMEIQKLRLEEQERRASSSTSKKRKYNLVSEVRFTLDNCSRFGDVNGALSVYKTNREAVKFDLYNYNVLLYLCSSAALGVLGPCKQSRQRPDFAENQGEFGLGVVDEDAVEEDDVVLRGNMAGLSGKNVMGFTEEMMDTFLKKGLEIFEQMQVETVAPNEATFTALARLSVAKKDGDLAFEIVKAMIAAGIPPKLRCYGPALYVFFKQNNADKALEVYNHMLVHGVQPEEAELEVLLHLCSKAGIGDQVYLLLLHLRETVRDVSESTVRVIERWFKSECATRLGGKSLPGDSLVKNTTLARGGGWHGLGWLGQGRWNVEYITLTKQGVCCCCNEQMVTIDITPQETDTFAKCVASLAFKRENNNSFGIFKDWLDKNGPYETVVDGANVGFYNQRFNGELNFAQLNSVVADVQRRSGKWPLVVLHVGRTVKGSGKSSYAQQLLRQWSNANALYIAPTGSNDDWYWLYAAVKCKSLLISNDEMRDHIFQLLGREFFPTWKERHQVRFEVTNQSPLFHMPPEYSIIIQEAEKGSWHIPVSGGDDISSPRKWLCVTRRST